MDLGRTERLVRLYDGKGLLDRVDGDARVGAAQRIALARDDLDGVRLLIDGGSYRLAFNAAYDTLRHAAEAVLRGAGSRVTSALGGHEAVFALADALVAGYSDGVFAGARAGSSRLKRNSLEYPEDNPVTVDELDAREVLQWASDAINAADSFLSRQPLPTI
ncbi:MAG: hypothetical protein ACRDVC_03015 [Acidimicrobiales bacterium]